MNKIDEEQFRRVAESGRTLIPLGRNSKIPTDRNWTKRQYCREKLVSEAVHNGTNLGVRLEASDLVIDVDPRAFPNGETFETENPFKRFCDAVDLTPDHFPKVRTGGGGLHVFARKADDRRVQAKLTQYPGVEFKTKGQQVVAAGSIHPDTGKLYVLDDPFDDLGSPDAAPAKLLDLISKPSRSADGGAGGEHTADELADMLEELDPEDFRDQGRWLNLMMACHDATAGNGRQEFIDWSTSDPEYIGHGEMIGRRWDSFGNDSAVQRVTCRTLYKELREAGSEDAIPRPDPNDDFVKEDGEEDLSLPTKPGAAHGGSPVYRGGLNVHPKTSVAPDNMVNALRAVSASGIEPRFDELKQRVVFAGHLPWDKGYGRDLTDRTGRLVRLLLMEQRKCNDYQPSKENVLEAVMTLAYADKFNPVIDYLDGLTWDGQARMDRLFSDGFSCGDSDYVRAVSRCFLIGAVARQRKPGCKFDTMPVIKGPQGSLKSSGFRDLFSPTWFSDAELSDLRSKDAAMNLEGVWVHEFAELAGLRASDMDVLKAFMSRAIDRFRAPYGRTVEDHPRRVVFVGTVNEGGYLSDPTGGRRFWPLEMQSGSRVELTWIALNRDQLWAEADEAFRAGVCSVLPESLWGVAAQHQADETVDDPWVDSICAFLERRRMDRSAFEAGTGDYAVDEVDGTIVQPMLPEPPPADRVHTRELLRDLGLREDRQNRGHTQRIRKVMESLGWTYKRGLRFHDRVGAGYEVRSS